MTVSFLFIFTIAPVVGKGILMYNVFCLRKVLFRTYPYQKNKQGAYYEL